MTPHHSLALAFAAVLATLGQLAPAATVLDDATMRERTAAAVVLLLVEDGHGTGFVLNSQGHIATNHHVVAGGGRIEARQGGRAGLAETVWSSERLDLAVLRVRPSALGAPRPLPLAISPPAPLLDVLAVGFPGVANAITAASAPSYNEGNVGRLVEGTWGLGRLRIVQHSADINPGNSGGPLLDACGRVVGVNTGIAAASLSLEPGGPRIEAPSGVFWASFIGELADSLDALSIPYTAAAGTCEAAPAQAPAQSGTLLALAVAGGALLIALAAFRRNVAQAASRVRESASRRVAASRSRRPPAERSPRPAHARAQRIRIGRGRRMDVTIPSAAASRLHAELEVPGHGRSQCVLRDCDSTNGTHVFRAGHWQRISREVVQPNDRVRFGDYETTVAALLAAGPGRQGDTPGARQRPADDRPVGPVKRNPGTGEVVRDD